MFDILRKLADRTITVLQARTQLMGLLGTHALMAERGAGEMIEVLPGEEDN